MSQSTLQCRRRKATAEPSTNGKPASYEPSLTKRSRRTKTEISLLKDAIYEKCQKHQPLNVRHLYYQMVVAALIPKTQAQYKSTIVRLCGEMREDGVLPWEWIVDDTRWARKPTSYGSLKDALLRMQREYRQDYWLSHDVYVEVWCESGSVAGVIWPITEKWDVPLMPAHGFSSKSFCWNTAKLIEYIDKPTHIFYVGDYDPSGVHIDRDIESKLRRYAPDADITFKRIAVLPEQIKSWKLPSAPPKKSDSRAKAFRGRAVEVEAIPPDTLRALVDDALTALVDHDSYVRILRVEQAEHETLDKFIAGMEGKQQ